MKFPAFFVGIFSVLSMLVGPTPAAVVVTSATPNGWSTYTTDENNNFSGAAAGVAADYAIPPATPPLGTGAAHLTTGTGHGDSSAQFRTTNFAGIRLDAITALSYSTFATAWNGQQLPYLTLWVDTDGDTNYDDRLFFEPDYTSPAALNTWQDWNALTGQWWNENGDFGPGANTGSLADYLAISSYSDARIVNAAGGLGGFRFASGFASDIDNFNAYFDNVTFATAISSVTYDFEVATDAAVPEPATLTLWSLGALGCAFASYRRRRSA